MKLRPNRRGEAWVNKHADMVIDIIARYEECRFPQQCFQKQRLNPPTQFIGKNNTDPRCLCVIRYDGNSRFFEFRNNKRYWI